MSRRLRPAGALGAGPALLLLLALAALVPPARPASDARSDSLIGYSEESTAPRVVLTTPYGDMQVGARGRLRVSTPGALARARCT